MTFFAPVASAPVPEAINAFANLGITDDGDTVTASSIRTTLATLSLIEDNDTLSAFASLGRIAMLNITENDDTLLYATGSDPNRVHTVDELYTRPAGWKKLFWQKVHIRDRRWRW